MSHNHSSNSSSSSSSSSEGIPRVTALPDSQREISASELDLIAPRPTLQPQSFIQVPRPGFIDEIDNVPTSMRWPWWSPQEAMKDLFPDWVNGQTNVSPTTIRYHFTIPINSSTLSVFGAAAGGAAAGFLLGRPFGRAFGLSSRGTLLSSLIFSGGLGGFSFVSSFGILFYSRYNQFFKDHPEGPKYDPPISDRQSYWGITKQGEIVQTPGLKGGLFWSPYGEAEDHHKRGKLNDMELKVLQAYYRRMEKEAKQQRDAEKLAKKEKEEQR